MLNLCIFSGQNSCHLFELFLWMLGSFLLGWFLSGYFNKSKDCGRCKNCDRCNGVETSATITSSGSAATSSFAAAAIVADDSVKDKLTKVEGIGPKIQEHLNNDGIWSFAQLAASSIARIQGILDAAGPRYKMHNPKTWAEQAALARDGKWAELKKWQDELDGGL